MLCRYCSQPIPADRLRFHAVFCSSTCRSASHKSNYRSLNILTGLSSGTVGAISELVVTTMLLQMGYDLFRAVSPACSCDLIAVTAGHSWRIEVRTGSYSPIGTPIYGWSGKDHVRSDVLAVVVNGRDVIFKPTSDHGLIAPFLTTVDPPVEKDERLRAVRSVAAAA
jgi:hypothetical protein